MGSDKPDEHRTYGTNSDVTVQWESARCGRLRCQPIILTSAELYDRGQWNLDLNGLVEYSHAVITRQRC